METVDVVVVAVEVEAEVPMQPCLGSKELEGHIFTIGSGNKGKDGDMLRTSMEKMTTYCWGLYSYGMLMDRPYLS